MKQSCFGKNRVTVSLAPYSLASTWIVVILNYRLDVEPFALIASKVRSRIGILLWKFGSLGRKSIQIDYLPPMNRNSPKKYVNGLWFSLRNNSFGCSLVLRLKDRSSQKIQSGKQALVTAPLHYHTDSNSYNWTNGDIQKYAQGHTNLFGQNTKKTKSADCLKVPSLLCWKNRFHFFATLFFLWLFIQ